MATLATLRLRLDGWVGRTDADYTGTRDTFLNQAIREIAKRAGVELGTVELAASTAVPQGTQSFAMPALLRMTSDTRLHVVEDDNTRTPLKQIPVEYLNREFYDTDDTLESQPTTPSGYTTLINLSDTTQQNKPQYFALSVVAGQRTIHIRQVPDQSYTIEVRGVALTSDLVNDADENFITLEAEDAVLYKALELNWLYFEDALRAAVWAQKAEPLIQVWKNTRIDAETQSKNLQMGTYSA